MDSRNIAAGIINNNREPRGSFFLSCTIMKFKNKQERIEKLKEVILDYYFKQKTQTNGKI